MLASISPVGEASRRQRWSVTVTAHLVGSALGGAAIGSASGALGQLLGTGSWSAWGLVVLAVGTLLGALMDLGWLPLHIPSRRRQVDERWLSEYRGWVYGAGFGVQLGAAVFTIVPSAITYATLLAAVLVGDPFTGGLIGVVFGATRAVPLLLTGFVRTPTQLRVLHERLDSATQTVGRATVAAQATIAALAVVGVAARPW